MRLALLLGCGLLLALPSLAHAADEQLISEDTAQGLTAHGKWVGWIANVASPPSGAPRIWDGAATTDLAGISGEFSLGSDSRGRAAVTYPVCRRTSLSCAIVLRDLPSGRPTVLLRDRANVTVAASDGGVVAYTRNFRFGHKPGPGSGLYLRRRGVRHVRRISRDEPDVIDIAAGRLVYITSRPDGPDNFDTIVRVLDLKTGPLAPDRIHLRFRRRLPLHR